MTHLETGKEGMRETQGGLIGETKNRGYSWQGDDESECKKNEGDIKNGDNGKPKWSPEYGYREKLERKRNGKMRIRIPDLVEIPPANRATLKGEFHT